MSLNPAMMSLPEELTTYLKALNAFQRKDVPPRWSEDEYRRYQDNRDNLMVWKQALIEHIEADLAP